MAPPAAVPLTLLSGFLGAGKTTLLKQILNNKEGIKCAVVVNDLASVNVDARLVGNECKGDDHLVHLENGCICCDLNEEFVEQVVSLARSGQFEYIIVENTGVADPEPVAESLVDPNVVLGDAQEKLASLVSLDTCVTVVDASMFFKHLHNGRRLNETELAENTDAEEADNLICQLLVSQIEYADVVVLNKTDLLAKGLLQDVRKAVQSLNPSAKVISCTYSQVEWRQLLGTGMFSKETTPADPLAPGAPPRDSNFEDAVSSFVYTDRMPFHPSRLHEFVTTHFHLHERDWTPELRASESDALAAIRRAAQTIAEASTALRKDNAAVRKAAELAANAAWAAVAASEAAGVTAAAPPKALVAGTGARKQPFGRLLRSKGVVWLAGPSRYDHCADWSHAGDVLQFTSGGPWMASMPLQLWPDDEAKRREIVAEFAPGTGDRRQELVFIGMDLKESAIRAALDRCLCTHLEMLESRGDVPDLFAPWPAVEDMLPETADEELSDQASGEDEEVSDGSATELAVQELMTAGTQAAEGSEHQGQPLHPVEDAVKSDSDGSIDAAWVRGQVQEVFEGGCELQRYLDDAESRGQPLLVAWWEDEWAPTHQQTAAAFAMLAESQPSLMFVRLNVLWEGNKALALEQVMKRSESRRRGAKFVLKSQAKWPCFTLHAPGQLVPLERCTGLNALESLAARIEARIATCLTVTVKPTVSQKGEDAGPAADAGLAEARTQLVACSTPRDSCSASVASAGTKLTAHCADCANVPGKEVGERAQCAAQVTCVEQGAKDLKPLVSQAKEGALVLLFWDSSTCTVDDCLEDLQQAPASVVTAHCDVRASNANRLLATKLRVRAFPALFTRVGSSTRVRRASEIPAFLSRLSAEISGEAAPSLARKTPATAQAPQQQQTVARRTPVATQGSQQSQTVASRTSAATQGAQHQQTDSARLGVGCYDPPPHPSATRNFPGKGIGQFWPKMPCLRCGCPWWSGEDWDAQCVRCGWSCETGGYDDDCKPLQKLKPKWERFTREIASGRCPEWPPQ